jgi:hypothetical protein
MEEEVWEAASGDAVIEAAGHKFLRGESGASMVRLSQPERRAED